MPNETEFSHKTAFVVGGYGCIGEAIAHALAAAGCQVIIAGRNLNKAQELARELESSGGRASGIALDANDVASIRHVTAAAWTSAQGIDFLINCLGNQREQPLLEVTEGDFDAVLSTNLKAAMFLAQAMAIEQIARGRGGKHVHLLSLRSVLGYRNRGYSAFTASKGGLAALVRQHAAELAPSGITVNGIAPGIVRTRKNATATNDPQTLQRMVDPIPLGRLAEPRDVAQVTLFLCSAAADFITGQTLTLDGGLTSCR